MQLWFRCAALAAGTVCGASAQAADWYTGAQAPARGGDWIVSVDASTTLSSQGSQFAGATVTAAPVGTLATSGPRLRFDSLIGSYRAPQGATTGLGQQAELAALAGYAFVFPDAVLSGFVGLNVRHNDLSGFAGPLESRTELGAKAALDLYARPSETTMVHATGSYSTTFNAYYGRLRAGVAAFGGYLGPEVALLGDDVYRQWRLGAHLTALQMGPVQFGIAAGYLQDRSRKGGLYTTLDMRAGF